MRRIPCNYKNDDSEDTMRVHKHQNNLKLWDLLVSDFAYHLYIVLQGFLKGQRLTDCICYSGTPIFLHVSSYERTSIA